MSAAAIRDAASVVLVRDGAAGPEVLMGLRGAQAAFLPSKLVFPGGAVDPGDHEVALAAPLPAPCRARLAEAGGSAALAHAVAVCALRELWEEIGIALTHGAPWPDAPPAWAAYAAAAGRPSAAGLRMIFRAITPSGRPRRFDARFFLAHAAPGLEPTAGDEELSALAWRPLADLADAPLPFVTELVLAEAAEALARGGPPEAVPFYDNRGPARFDHLRGLGRTIAAAQP